MLTHVHYGETLCGWRYRSKVVVKGVECAGHRVTRRVRFWDRTHSVLNSSSGSLDVIGRVRYRYWTRPVFNPGVIS
jgi:hypothetical protein